MRYALIFALGLTMKAPARTVEDVVRQYGPAAEARLKKYFTTAKAAYPPKKIALIGLKKENQLELWAEEGGKWKFLHSYPVLAASGMAGPKLRQGDLQVPEGFYKIIVMNPNSSYHLSMKLDYPNTFDKKRAEEEGRGNLGGDIFIHGRDVSIGCLALGDPAIEELFTLVARIGREKVQVLVTPHDFRVRKKDPSPLRYEPPWLAGLYADLRKELAKYTP